MWNRCLAVRACQSRARSAPSRDVAPETVPYAGRGRRPVARYRQRRSSLRQLVLAASAQAVTTVAWREGADGQPLASSVRGAAGAPAGIRLRRARRVRKPG